MTTADLLLQYEVASGDFHCIEFRGVPAVRKGLICLAGAGEASRGEVEQLMLAIKTDLLRSGTVDAEEVPCLVDPSEFYPSIDPEHGKVLFLIPSENPPLRNVAWYARWNSDDFISHVMIAAKTDKYTEMFDMELRGPDKSEHLLRASLESG